MPLSLPVTRSAVAALGAALSLWLSAATVQAAGITMFEWNETPTPATATLQSRHATNGPVLADDFVPVIGGPVTHVTWWGSQASVSDLWEVTFHANTAANDPAYPFISQQFLSGITGTDPDGDGIFEYSAAWTAPSTTVLTAGTQYWFSVANGTPGWLWANAGAGGPQVGSENFSALQSVGGLPSLVPGPHDGPWSTPTVPGAVVVTDLAFRISTIPVPATFPLLLAGLAGFAGIARRRRSPA